MQAPKQPLSLVRRWVLFAAAVAIIASCEAPIPDNFHIKAVDERKPTPDFNLKDATGANVKLSDYKGKVVFILLGYLVWAVQGGNSVVHGVRENL